MNTIPTLPSVQKWIVSTAMVNVEMIVKKENL